MKKFYITTTLPYVNAKPHMGHALEFVQADAIARYQREVLHKDVVFNTGTDEHGLKIYRKSIEVGKSAQAYVDESVMEFKKILKIETGLNISFSHFIRTTDAKHKSAAQEFWKICKENGDIYKKNYKVKYCVGCELDKTESDLVDGKCPLHPNLEIELIDEENYFFRFSKYQRPLLDFYKSHPNLVLPNSRFNEITKFVEMGLEDFSISRLAERMPWGIPVPDDQNHVMYVWFDALINYISTIGWPVSLEEFSSFWGTKDNLNAVQIAGKDNLRQQAAMWQAMLMSAGIPNSKTIIIHGFINSNGQKMSKSLGNVVDPYEMVQEYGTDALRYFLLREIPVFEDGDFTKHRFEESYNSGLVNGLGNLVSRVLKMASANAIAFDTSDNRDSETSRMALDANLATWRTYHQAFEDYNIKLAVDAVWQVIASANRYIEETEPFKKIKTDRPSAEKDISYLLMQLSEIAKMISPLLPATSAKISEALKDTVTDKSIHLFPRKSV